MRLFGFDLSLRRATKAAELSSVPSPDRGWLTIFDWRPGAWQSHQPISADSVLAHTALFACVTLIAADIAKMRLRLMERVGSVWREADNPAFTPLLRKPNHYQTRQQFIEAWMLSKLTRGNSYLLKVRDDRGVVTDLLPLDPDKVTPLVSTSGDVFYQLGSDELARLTRDIAAAPASEVIHDRFNCIFHPLVGVSPIFACGLAAQQGLNILRTSDKFFGNGAQPGGVLTAPAKISDETAARIKQHWEREYTGDNAGKVAVLGDGLKYEALSVNAVDADLIAQLKMSGEMVCSAFHMPAFKAGVGPMPTYQNAQVLNQIYYGDCLQAHIEAVEALFDEGVLRNGRTAVNPGYRTEFDVDDLLRMDTATQMDVVTKGVGAAIFSPDEGRQRFNLAPVPGGKTPYLQQQNYSLAALDKRDREDPFAKPAPAPAPPPPADDEEDDPAAAATAAAAEEARAAIAEMRALAATVAAKAEERATAAEQQAQAAAFAAALIQRLSAGPAHAR